MDSKGYAQLDDFVGKAVPNVTDWQFLNLKYDIKALIDQDQCIKCGLCHIACEDTSHQAIRARRTACVTSKSIDDECVGCNLCMHVCPVDDCITMERVDDGSFQQLDHASEQPDGGEGLMRAKAMDFDREPPVSLDLINTDLMPTAKNDRTWDWKAIAALWVGMVVCVPTYMLAAGLVSEGMSWKAGGRHHPARRT